VSVVGGLLPSIDMWGDDAWWSGRPFPGFDDKDRALGDLQGKVLSKSGAFRHLSLRQDLKVSTEKGYAILRYDAMGSGEAAVAVFNFDGSPLDVDVFMYKSLAGKRATDMLTGKGQQLSDSTKVAAVPGYGYRIFKVEGALPTWEFKSTDMCTEKRDLEQLSVPGCFLKCLEEGATCTGVNIGWTTKQEVVEELVQCYLLSNAACTAGTSSSAWSHFVRSDA